MFSIIALYQFFNHKLDPKCQCQIGTHLSVYYGIASCVKECVMCTGGCGAMYKIIIEAEEFRGKKTLDQHHLVNEVMPIFV